MQPYAAAAATGAAGAAAGAAPHAQALLDSSAAGILAGTPDQRQLIDLAALLKDLGYTATQSPRVLSALLASLYELRPKGRWVLSAHEVARTLLMFASTATGLRPVAVDVLAAVVPAALLADIRNASATSWNTAAFAAFVAEAAPTLPLADVVAALDQIEQLKDSAGIAVIFDFLKTAAQGPYNIPIHVFFTPWNNPMLQFQFLRYIVQTSPSLVARSKTLTDLVIPVEDVALLPRSQQPLASSHPWNSLGLIEILVLLSDVDSLYDDIKDLMEAAIQQCPEFILLGLVQLTTPWNKLRKELTPSLVMLFVTGHPNSSFILPRLWQLNQTLTMTGLVHLYHKDPTSISRILDIAQDMKALSQILEAKSYQFSIDLAALASRRDYLNLEKWLQDHIIQEGAPFVEACLAFLSEKISSRKDSNVKRLVPLPIDVVVIFLRILRLAMNSSPNFMAKYSEVVNECAVAYPKIQFGPNGIEIDGDATGGDLQQIPQQATQTQQVTQQQQQQPQQQPQPQHAAIAAHAQTQEDTFSEEVEKEANIYFSRIYKGELSIAETIDLLLEFLASPDPVKQDIYKCMIRDLFEEYKFFDRYPDKELGITSILFGTMIDRQVVTARFLGLALRYVLDALRQPSGSRIFRFGIQALHQFQGRLKEWPQYCALILQIEDLHQTHPQLIQAIQSIQQQERTSFGQSDASARGNLDSMSPPSTQLNQYAPAAGTASQELDAERSEEFASIDPEALRRQLIQTEDDDPSEQIRDKIMFAINNISFENLEAKVEETREVLVPAYFKWFSDYLVVKRAKIEPNFHKVYIAYLEALGLPELEKQIVYETLVNIKTLLDSPKVVTSSQERSNLKNLGTWLGGITLARGKPIQHRFLSFKDLLLEGYYTNKLIVVIPFVCKVLEQCQDNSIFKPPNPWLMAVMRLLTELFHNANLKLNLKFEVEVLCKKLKLDIKDIEPSKMLSVRYDGPQGTDLVKTFSQIMSKDGKMLLARGAIADAYGNPAYFPDRQKQLQQEQLKQHEQQHLLQKQQQLQQQQPADIGIDTLNLAPYLIFNVNFAPFATQPALKQVVLSAFDLAIRDVAAPVLERSVTIAGIATRELVTKDFALEADENKMRRAAQAMVATLAGSLASVSSREPLRSSMVNHLRTLLSQSGVDEQAFPDPVIFMVVEDNLELACSVMEKAVASKAIPDIDETLQSAYLARRLHRQRSTQPYVDPIFTASRFPSTLPEPLRLKPGGLNDQQLKIYEDFREIAAQQQRHHQLIYQQQVESAKIVKGREAETQEGALRVQIRQQMEKFTSAVEELQGHTEQYDTQTLEMFGAEHPVRELARKVHQIITQVSSHDEILLIFAQKLFSVVYNVRTTVSREIFILLASSITESSKRVTREIREWLLYNDDERKFNVPATVSLLKAHFISMVDLDSQLYRLTEIQRESGIEFAISIIDKCVLDENSFAFPADFLLTLSLFRELEAGGKASTAVVKLLDDIKTRFSLSHLRSTIASRWEESKKAQKKGSNNKSETGEEEGQLFDEEAEEEMIREYISIVFMDWVHTYYHPNTCHKSCDQFIKYLAEQGFLSDKELLPYLLRVGLEISLESYRKARLAAQHAITTNSPTAVQVTSRVYQALDAYSRLIVLIIKHAAESDIETLKSAVERSDGSGDKLAECNVAGNTTVQSLSVIVLLLNMAHTTEMTAFNQRPFCRIFSTILNDLTLFEKFFGPLYDVIISSVSDVLHSLQPSLIPGFAFSWLQLISHHNFMPKMLLAEGEKLWPSYLRLCTDLLKFLVIVLKSPITDATRLLYNGTLRLILVILHDFPEFLAEYHFTFMDLLPAHCAQAKNLVLSASPRTIRLPDAFATTLVIDQLPEIGVPPKIRSDFASSINDSGLRPSLDEYLAGNLNKKASELFLQSLVSKVKTETDGKSFSAPLVNALVLYLCDSVTQGTGAVADLLRNDGEGLKALTAGTRPITPTADENDENSEARVKAREAASAVFVVAIKEVPHYAIFQRLLAELDLEGTYTTISYMVNHIRYPNSHTLFFNKLILTIFAETKDLRIKEQITRVLLERLIVVRPHPYGLLVTFIELVRNGRYKFWDLGFIRCAPEIEAVLARVSNALSEHGDIRQIANLYLSLL